MTDALPLLKGSPEALETSMLLILKRVNKMFEKLVNKPDLMVRIACEPGWICCVISLQASSPIGFSRESKIGFSVSRETLVGKFTCRLLCAGFVARPGPCFLAGENINVIHRPRSVRVGKKLCPGLSLEYRFSQYGPPGRCLTNILYCTNIQTYTVTFKYIVLLNLQMEIKIISPKLTKVTKTKAENERMNEKINKQNVNKIQWNAVPCSPCTTRLSWLIVLLSFCLFFPQRCIDWKSLEVYLKGTVKESFYADISFIYLCIFLLSSKASSGIVSHQDDRKEQFKLVE